MKAIILAAGMGTRLGTLIPKPMTPIKDEMTILDFQVEALKNIIGENNIIVILGYKKDMIMEKHPELTYVYNPDYARTNTSKSLLRAIVKVDEDFLFLNGDVYFEEDVLRLLVGGRKTSFLVNKSRVEDEEIKYNTQENGYILELSKNVQKPLGEAIGINYVVQNDINSLRKALVEVNDNDYFEKAFENLSKSGAIQIMPVDIGTYYVKEIDFSEDLDEVKKYLIKKGMKND